MITKGGLFKRILLFLLLSCLLICLTGCCSHIWQEASCTSPKTCVECGLTEGEVVHSFGISNCVEMRKCNKCGIEIEPVGHKWLNETCISPKICEICNEIEGTALGHSTRYGICSRCDENINDIEFKNGFAVVTFSDTTWMKEKDDFVDIYIVGKIEEISKWNEIIIVDAEGEKWTADIGTGCDFSAYIGTECEIYGFSSGAISSQHNTPLINMNHSENYVLFVDGKSLYPNDFSSEQQFKNKYTENNLGGNGGVWIPTDGGNKYHSKATCSGMYNPEKISKNEAVNRGLSKCGKCW